MRRATDIRRAGTWPVERATATVTLAFDDRHRRRLRMIDDSGDPFLLDLAEATLLAEGDGLALSDGGIVRVRAADEPVVDIACDSAAHAARVAWHLGNRHTAVEIRADGVLRIRDDHVLARMAEGLGARVTRHAALFAPESGAYAAHHGHGPGHSHEHDHSK